MANSIGSKNSLIRSGAVSPIFRKSRRNNNALANNWEAMDQAPYIRLWKNLCEDRDPTSFNQLFDELLPVILRLLERNFNTIPLNDREDSTSDAFLVLLLNPERFDPARATLPTFLYTIARNKLIDRLRAEQRHSNLSETLAVSTEEHVENQAIKHLLFAGRDERSELRPEVQDWLEKTLPNPRDQALFLLSVEERLTVDAFAELYEVHTLSLDEQRREMKRHRDRITKRVTRDRATLRQLLVDSTDSKEIAPYGN